MNKLISIKDNKKTKLYKDFQSYMKIKSKPIDEIIELFIGDIKLTDYLPLSEKEIRENLYSWIKEYQTEISNKKNENDIVELIEKAISNSDGNLKLAELQLSEELKSIMIDEKEEQIRRIAKKLIEDYFTQNQMK